MADLKTLLQQAMRRAVAGEAPKIPDGGRLVWGWFLDLSRSRTGTGSGPNPITHAEVAAYAQLHRWPLEGRHVELLFALDRIWLEHAYSRTSGSPAGPAASPEITMTAAAFDAVFT